MSIMLRQPRSLLGLSLRHRSLKSSTTPARTFRAGSISGSPKPSEQTNLSVVSGPVTAYTTGVNLTWSKAQTVLQRLTDGRSWCARKLLTDIALAHPCFGNGSNDA